VYRRNAGVVNKCRGVCEWLIDIVQPEGPFINCNGRLTKVHTNKQGEKGAAKGGKYRSNIHSGKVTSQGGWMISLALTQRTSLGPDRIQSTTIINDSIEETESNGTRTEH